MTKDLIELDESELVATPAEEKFEVQLRKVEALEDLFKLIP